MDIYAHSTCNCISKASLIPSFLFIEPLMKKTKVKKGFPTNKMPTSDFCSDSNFRALN